MSQGFATRWIVRLLPTILVLQAMAGGPNYVTGPSAAQPGQPYRWAGNGLSYKTDLGGLGNQTSDQADAMVAAAFNVWQNVSTADVHIQSEGKLSLDITASNILTFYSAIRSCSDASQPSNSILYDQDGSIIAALGLDKNSILGFAGILCPNDTNDTTGIYTRGWSVMNGRFIDGQASSPSHQSVSLEAFQGVFIHEFGHLLGLDHSQINVNCISGSGCPAAALAGIPTMFPVLLGLSQATPKTDDIAAISSLYPASTFYANTGRIQGQVLFADGLTPAQGYNVIARQVGNPRSIAVSSVSGFLFTAGAGNSLVPGGMDSSFSFGSHDASLIGYYDISGLPPGAYTVEAEAINNSAPIPFVNASGVGPIGDYLGFQYKMPGTCSLQYLNSPSLPTDNCSARTTVTLGAGQVLNTNTDIIMIGTPPRFDAWEDEP
jgi:hypothetical protein